MILVSHNIHPDVFLGRLVTQSSWQYSVLTFSQKVHYNQKVQECQSLRTELSRFVTTPTVSTASSAASAHTGLSSTSRSSASPPSSRVASPTSSPSYISNLASPLSRLGLTRSASVAPTPPARSASVAPTGIYRPCPNLNAWHLFCFSPICDTCRTVVPLQYPCITIACSQVSDYVDVTTPALTS